MARLFCNVIAIKSYRRFTIHLWSLKWNKIYTIPANFTKQKTNEWPIRSKPESGDDIMLQKGQMIRLYIWHPYIIQHHSKSYWLRNCVVYNYTMNTYLWRFVQLHILLLFSTFIFGITSSMICSLPIMRTVIINISINANVFIETAVYTTTKNKNLYE